MAKTRSAALVSTVNTGAHQSGTRHLENSTMSRNFSGVTTYRQRKGAPPLDIAPNAKLSISCFAESFAMCTDAKTSTSK